MVRSATDHRENTRTYILQNSKRMSKQITVVAYNITQNVLRNWKMRRHGKVENVLLMSKRDRA